jgi:hypothetical protein
MNTGSYMPCPWELMLIVLFEYHTLYMTTVFFNTLLHVQWKYNVSLWVHLNTLLNSLL